MSATATAETRGRYSVTDRWRSQNATAGRCESCGLHRPIVSTRTVHYARCNGARGTYQENVCAGCLDDDRDPWHER